MESDGLSNLLLDYKLLDSINIQGLTKNITVDGKLPAR
jgi:hypothetical protein